MSTATEATPARKPANLPSIRAERLPFHPAVQERFGIDRSQWRALVEAIFPLAQTIDSVILALSYCRARNLDPFKRVVHIVPIWDSKAGRSIDTIWPGIGELRTTAIRTKEFAGRDKTEFGPDITEKIGTEELTYPEWAQVTVYRMVQGQRVAFAGPQVYWKETYAERGGKNRDKTPNAMWLKRPRGQIDKCAEAAALRAAFPEEIGNDITNDEAGSTMLSNSIQTTASEGGSKMDRIGSALSPEPEAVDDIIDAEAEPADESPVSTLEPRENEQPESYVQRLLGEIDVALTDETISDIVTVAEKYTGGFISEDQLSRVSEAGVNRVNHLLKAKKSGKLT